MDFPTATFTDNPYFQVQSASNVIEQTMAYHKLDHFEMMDTFVNTRSANNETNRFSITNAGQVLPIAGSAVESWIDDDNTAMGPVLAIMFEPGNAVNTTATFTVIITDLKEIIPTVKASFNNYPE